MATPFDKYLERLRQKKASASTFNAYSKGASSLTGTGNYIANKMSGLRLGNTSASARYAMQQQSQEQIGSQIGQLYGETIQNESQRVDQLDSQIGQLQVQQEQYKKQQKDAKQARTRQMLTTVGQIGGAAVGALFGAPGIGAGVGGALGSIVPTKGGAPADYGQALQSTADAFVSYASYSNEKKMQGSLKYLGQKMPELGNLSASQLGSLSPILYSMLVNGSSQEDIDTFLSGYLNKPVMTGNALFNAPDFTLGGK
jgi:hypothetical protein